MDTHELISLIKESFFMLVVFGTFLVIALAKGRYALVNIILALYLAFLISLKFPFYEAFASEGSGSSAIVQIVIFILLTIAGIFLFRRLIPGDDYEKTFESFPKKLLLAVMATVLVMAYSYHALPVTDLITPGSPIQALFGPEDRFFFWLLIPLVALFFI